MGNFVDVFLHVGSNMQCYYVSYDFFHDSASDLEEIDIPYGLGGVFVRDNEDALSQVRALGEIFSERYLLISPIGGRFSQDFWSRVFGAKEKHNREVNRRAALAYSE